MTEKNWQDNYPKNDTPANWENRIIRYGDADVDDLLANPFNARIHGQAQQAALLGLLTSVGLIDTICINETTGHLVDGHLRMVLADRHHVKALPARWIAVNENEEKIILASFDWITSLATYDRDQLDTLLQAVNTDNEALQTMLAGMAQNNNLYIPDDFKEYDETVADEVEYITCPHCGEKFPK